MSAVEDEVDFRHYWTALVARWWLPVAGLLVGVAVGFLVASSSKSVNRSAVTIYLGQPLGAAGGALIQTVGTNPTTVRTVIHSQDALERAAKASGLSTGTIDANVTSAPVAGAVVKLGQTPLVKISLTANKDPKQLEKAVTSLADSSLAAVAPYVLAKIQNFKLEIAQDVNELKLIDLRLNRVAAEVQNPAISATDKLVLLNLQALGEQRRTVVLNDRLGAKQLLSQARDVELGKIVAPAASEKTTARSRTNSMIVGGLIGLIIGTVAALVLGRRRLD